MRVNETKKHVRLIQYNSGIKEVKITISCN